MPYKAIHLPASNSGTSITHISCDILVYYKKPTWRHFMANTPIVTLHRALPSNVAYFMDGPMSQKVAFPSCIVEGNVKRHRHAN